MALRLGRRKRRPGSDAKCDCGTDHGRTMTCDAARQSDPTGTLPLRRALARELDARWVMVRRAIRSQVGAHDILAVSPETASNHLFSTGASRLTTAQTWLDNVIYQHVIGHDGGEWLAEGVRRAYASGSQRAAQALRRPLDVDHGRAAAHGAVAIMELEGVVEATSQNAMRSLAAVLAIRGSPTLAARALTGAVDTVGALRARMVVSVEVVRAYGGGTLDALESAGVAQVSVMPEMLPAPRQTGRFTDWNPDQPRDPAGSPTGGQWVSLYHGSPTRGIEQLRGEHAFLTPSEKVAREYAKNELMGAQRGATKREPTVYEIEADLGETLDLRKSEHRNIYNEFRREYNAQHDDPDYHLPSIKNQPGLLGFGSSGEILREARKRGFSSLLVEEGSQGVSVLVADPARRTRIKKHSVVDAKRRTPRMSPYRQRRAERAEEKLERLERVGVLTAGDYKVCLRCEEIAAEGPYDIDEARTLIPAHPHCRCAFDPV